MANYQITTVNESQATNNQLFIFQKEVEMKTPSGETVVVLQEDSRATLQDLTIQKNMLVGQMTVLQGNLNDIEAKLQLVTNAITNIG